MSKNDIWYGFLQAGEKSSPVVRDMTLEDKSRNTVYLYNHVRGKFVEYSREVVESKLRKLQPEDIPLDELDRAFKAARKSFSPVKVVKKWSDASPAPPTEENDELEIPLDIDPPVDDFIDDES